MENIEILKKFERLPIERRVEILRKYQEEIASKETLSLQLLIDYLATNCVLADYNTSASRGQILQFYYGVFFEDNSFDIGYAFNSVDEACYLYSEKCNYIKKNKIEGKTQYSDQFLSPLYPAGTKEEDCCWYHGYTFKRFSPEDKAFVLPLSKMVVPRMVVKEGTITFISDETLLSIYQNTSAFLNSNSGFYQDAIVPMAKTLRKK